MQDYNNEFEFEYDDELEMEYDDEMEMEYDDEFEMEYDDEFEFEYDDEMEYDDEDAEMAYELLAVQSDEELDQFLGGLFRKAVSGAGRFIRSRAGQALKRKFVSKAKGFGRRMLPKIGRHVGGYLGNRFGGSRGRHYGGRAGHNIGRFFVDKWGWELEGLAPEQQEMEVAKKLIKIVKSAAKTAAKTAQSRRAPADVVVKAAIKSAAKKHLKKGLGVKKSGGSRFSGRWYKKGNKIIVQGV